MLERGATRNKYNVWGPKHISLAPCCHAFAMKLTINTQVGEVVKGQSRPKVGAGALLILYLSG